MSRRAVTIAASMALVTAFAATDAFAACTRLAFSVNDYGKVGPTKDAKDLLDKYIKTWTSERGIKSYTVGAKDVSCELFLDFVVFDEYTCKASALVCWSGPRPAEPTNASLPAGASVSAPSSGPAPKPAPKKAPQAAVPAGASPIATGSVAPVKASTGNAPAPKAPEVERAPAAEPASPPPATGARENPVAPPAQN